MLPQSDTCPFAKRGERVGDAAGDAARDDHLLRALRREPLGYPLCDGTQDPRFSDSAARHESIHAASGSAAPSWLRNRSVEYALPVSTTMWALSERDSNVRRFVSVVSSTEYEMAARSQTASWSPILIPFDRDLNLNAKRRVAVRTSMKLCGNPPARRFPTRFMTVPASGEMCAAPSWPQLPVR